MPALSLVFCFFFFNDTATTEIYTLSLHDALPISPDYAAEMAAYDPTSGELRTHYAGFFDPGFGFDPEGGFQGSRAALEVRAHDVPFTIEHRQRVCKLSFERMVARPDLLYVESIGSAYQQQSDTLSKHFRQLDRPEAEARAAKPRPSEDPVLFDERDA